jgi:hypothetical protein
MRSTPMILDAEPLEGCTVRVRFEDGTSGAGRSVRTQALRQVWSDEFGTWDVDRDSSGVSR